MGLTHPHSPTPPASAPPALRAARGAEVVAAIEAKGGNAEFVGADLKSPDEVRALAGRAADVDILVNNAGVFPGGPTHELPEATFDETFAVNVKAPFLLTAAIAPRMVERGGGNHQRHHDGRRIRDGGALRLRRLQGSGTFAVRPVRS